MIPAAAESFRRHATVIARDVRFVNFICDAWTVLLVKVMYSGLANRTANPDILLLNGQANEDWNAEQYGSFFRESRTNRVNDFGILGIWGVICDNLPA
jgi:hypothetical protein